MSAAAVIIRKQKRYIREFRHAHATRPEAARTLADLGLRNSWVFRRMADFGVFVEADPGRWYLDTRRAARFTQYRRAKVLIFTVLSLIVLVVILTAFN